MRHQSSKPTRTFLLALHVYTAPKFEHTFPHKLNTCPIPHENTHAIAHPSPHSARISL